MRSSLKMLTRLNLVVCLYHLIILLQRAQQAMLVMKELARREATLGIVTMNVIMELRLQDQIKNDERVLHVQRMNTG